MNPTDFIKLCEKQLMDATKLGDIKIANSVMLGIIITQLNYMIKSTQVI